MRKLYCWLVASFLLFAAAPAYGQSTETTRTGPSSASGQDDQSTEKADSSQASQTASNSCEYHVDCPSEHVCVRGSCVGLSKLMKQFSAEEACGANRRCRIQRLKRRNRARRHIRKLEEERRLEDKIDQHDTKQIEEIPRLDRPLGFDFRLSRMGVLGLVGGYTFYGHLRPELQLVYWNSYVSVDHDNTNYSGDHQATYIMPGIYYFFTEGEYAPYIGTKFVYGKGTFQNSADDFFGDRSSNDQQDVGEVETTFHALELEAGLDYQLEEYGLHFRLGLAYRPLIYNQASTDPGQYSDGTRAALEDWFGQMMRLDLILLAGWAF